MTQDVFLLIKFREKSDTGLSHCLTGGKTARKVPGKSNTQDTPPVPCVSRTSAGGRGTQEGGPARPSQSRAPPAAGVRRHAECAGVGERPRDAGRPGWDVGDATAVPDWASGQRRQACASAVALCTPALVPREAGQANVDLQSWWGGRVRTRHPHPVTAVALRPRLGAPGWWLVRGGLGKVSCCHPPGDRPLAPAATWLGCLAPQSMGETGQHCVLCPAKEALDAGDCCSPLGRVMLRGQLPPCSCHPLPCASVEVAPARHVCQPPPHPSLPPGPRASRPPPSGICS